MCYATGTIPCSEACDEAGRCLLSQQENEMQRPSQAEIEEVLNWAYKNTDDGTSQYFGMSYEEGVIAGIEWALGEREDRPDG